MQLGRTDWGLFSARPYGVPFAALRPLVEGPPTFTELPVEADLEAPVPWCTALLELPAPSPLAGRTSLGSAQLLTPFWRLAFGRALLWGVHTDLATCVAVTILVVCT